MVPVSVHLDLKVQIVVKHVMKAFLVLDANKNVSVLKKTLSLVIL